MMSFLQNALVQSQSDVTKAPADNFEQRIGSLMNRVSQSQAGAVHNREPEPEVSPNMPTTAPKELGNMGAALVELSEVANQLARVDLMLAQVTEGSPQDDEAKKFQEISLKALRWSRELLCQKQARYLADLGAVADAGTNASEPQEPTSPEHDPEMPKWMGWSKEAVEACPEFVPTAVKACPGPEPRLVGGGSLREDLEFLRECEPDRVMIVRKIKKLGFSSPKLLEEHFLQYGEVSNILVAHSHVKPTSKRPHGRVRPAALGFVVMASAEGVQCALEAGKDQALHDAVIELSPFNAFDDLQGEDGVDAWDTFQ